MNKPLVILLTLFLMGLESFAADMYQWQRLGFNFEVSEETYHAASSLYQKASAEIASYLIELITTKIPSGIAKSLEGEKIIIIFEKKFATDAVFFPPGTYRESEEKEWIITINPSFLLSTKYLRLTGHEFFHLIHFHFQPEEKSWVREGLAQLFETQIHGGFNQTHVEFALTKSEFALESDFNVNNYQPEQYGNTVLFFSFLTKQCGKDISIWDFLQTKKTGREGIDETLKNASSKKAICADFISIARAFSIAKMVNRYSGFAQSNETYIMDSNLVMESTRNLQNSLTNLRPMRPVKVAAQDAKKAKPYLDNDVEIYSVGSEYPNNISKIDISKIDNLPLKTDLLILNAK